MEAHVQVTEELKDINKRISMLRQRKRWLLDRLDAIRKSLQKRMDSENVICSCRRKKK